MEAPYVEDPPENFADQDFWRWVRESTSWDISSGNANALANSRAHAMRQRWSGGGLPSFYDLASPDGESSAYFQVSLKRAGREGLVLTSHAAAETYFRRPQARGDGQRELPNAFHPYWQARLRAVDQAVSRPRRKPQRPRSGKAMHRLARSPFKQGSDSCPYLGQRGQALLESLVAVMALAVLWVAVNWLAHYQDMALSASHASRHAAFLATRADPEPIVDDGALGQRFFSGSAHRWVDRRGTSLLQPENDIQLSWRRHAPLTALSQPAAASAYANTLRRDWSVHDRGILQATVAVEFPQPGPATGIPDGLLKLSVFDEPYVSFSRSLSVLTAAGHTESDTATQARLADSPLAWALSAATSRTAGAAVAVLAHDVDAAWGRSGPQFDWLQPWQGQVPPHLLVDPLAAYGRDSASPAKPLPPALDAQAKGTEPLLMQDHRGN